MTATKYRKGIPTTYRGVQFRSRLEARWAIMMDAFAWHWEYEPIDLPGYIPDFMVDLGKPMMVEVKPITDWHSTEWAEAAGKAIAAGVEEKFMILGAKLFKFSGALAIGKIYNPQSSGIEEPCWPAILHHCLGQNCGLPVPTPICPFNETHAEEIYKVDSCSYDRYWIVAGNEVQYRGAK